MYSLSQKNRFVAVEFDNVRDWQFHDPDDNHVGLDINSIVSVKTTPSAMLRGINLKSTFPITAWIDYQSRKKKLEFHDPDDNHVGLDIDSIVSVKTTPSAMLGRINLKRTFPITTWIDYHNRKKKLEELTFVGFSASTEESTEVHIIKNWSFRERAKRQRLYDHRFIGHLCRSNKYHIQNEAPSSWPPICKLSCHMTKLNGDETPVTPNQ
ncbi:PREDICTED: probable L-type lectin-domain containing receptor kinase S.7 [Ipomoea nil]|uniref:probable L-type lectin-domain containing receptor kinase S.7 n=1 Tax=Ipomoea nil TaxID=35883 RepID=UPI000900ABE1|nr:PREDICTED: probable L-type lectin-domain containing receptor kinase S.7 [Ipomoea nil]